MNAISNNTKILLPWIDWMKSIGIYLIVLGHFGSEYSVYLYVFSVQLFFWISGLLSPGTQAQNKVGGGIRLWFNKLLYNLIIPMVIICVCTLCIRLLISALHHQFSIAPVLDFVPCLALGIHSAVINMWFVYTLIVLKLIMHFASRNKYLPTLLLPILPFIGYIIDRNFQPTSCALLNTTMAYPFYYLGFIMRNQKLAIDTYRNRTIEVLALFACIVIVALCAKYNGFVWMFCNEYGNSFTLYMLGGAAGTLAILIISKWLSRFSSELISVISKGTIIILGFHLYLIFFSKSIMSMLGGGCIFEIFAAMAIVLLFVPIIKVLERRFPLIIGKYRVKAA